MTRIGNLISKRRRLPSPAMIVALGALVMSTGGTVTAAALITSANIKDNTIRSVDIRDETIRSRDVDNGSLTGADLKNRSLTGVDVKNGSLTGADVNESSLAKVPAAANATNAQNAGKVDGLDSANLVPGGVLPSGRTIKGAYALEYLAAAAIEPGRVAISFGASLPAAPAASFIPQGVAATAECPGSAANPTAAPGHLCVYEGYGANVKWQQVIKPSTFATGADPFGAGIWMAAKSSGAVVSQGTWAVTAP
jgi:hypothetical protein